MTLQKILVENDVKGHRDVSLLELGQFTAAIT